MRLFWRILAAFGGLILLLIVAVAIAVRTIDVNKFIAPLQQRVKEATGRDLVIRGGIDFKLSLEPMLVLDDVSLSNSEWGTAAQMVTAKRVEAQVKLLPLLQRRFEIVRFKLIDPVISLETNAAGKGNWDFSTAQAGGAPAPDSARAFAIGDLAIDHGTASYRDGESGKTTPIVIDELSLHSRDAQSHVSARFRGSVGDIAIAMEGDLGPLQVLAQQHLPYPVSLKGQINGQDTSVASTMRIDGRSLTLDELQINTGTAHINGQFALTPGAPRSKATFKLAAATLAWADLPFAHKLAGAVAKVPSPRGGFVFSDEKLDFGPLLALDADGDLSIGTLLLAEGRKLDNVNVRFTVRNGKLDVPLLQAAALGGSVRAHGSVDAARGQDPALDLHVNAKDVDLGALLTLLGMHRDVRGGKTEVSLDIATHGGSPREWARGASGTALIVTGPATLTHSKVDAVSPFEQLARAINPFFNVDSLTELECAVVRLPLVEGVAHIDRSIALETAKFGASASGTLDFRNETVDLAIKPQIRRGVPIEVPQIANLVRFEGPLRSPAVRIDAAGSAAAAARIGAAFFSGGLSIVGESLLSAARGGTGACRTALGSGDASTPTTGASTTPALPTRKAESKASAPSASPTPAARQ
jgi:uncharacterized protein involved in outer membrane biogenesis